MGQTYPRGGAPRLDYEQSLSGLDPGLAGVVARSYDYAQEIGYDPNHPAFAPWDRWRPSARREDLSPVAVEVGRLLVQGLQEAPPVFMGNLGQCHAVFPEEAWAVPLARTMLQRIMGCAPFCIDEYDLKGDFGDFNGLDKGGLIEHVPIDGIEAKIAELAALQRDILSGRRPEIGTVRDPRHILVLNGSLRLSEKARDQLAYLTQSGAEWGMLLAIGVDVPESKFMVRGLPGADIVSKHEKSGKVAYRIDPAPSELIKRTVAEISSTVPSERGKPFSVLGINEGRPSAELSDGGELKVLLGREQRSGRYVIAELGGDTSHWFFEGRTGSGKSFALRDIVLSLAKKYSPEQLEIYYIDGGPSAAVFGTSTDDKNYLPHIKLLAPNMRDPEYGVEVLLHLQNILQERDLLIERYGADSIATLRRRGNIREKLPKIVLVWDELQRLVQDEQWGGYAATILENILSTGRKCDMHVIGATPSMSGVKELWRRDAARLQFGLRGALKGSEGVMDVKNENWYSRLKEKGEAWINNNGGEGPADCNKIIRFPTASDEEVRIFKANMSSGAASRPPLRFNSQARPVLEDSKQYRELTPGSGRKMEVLVGQEFAIDARAATVDLSDEHGRNLLVLGNKYPEEIQRVIRSAAKSIAAQHVPSKARFSLICSDSKFTDAARGVARELRGTGHSVALVEGRDVASFMDAAAADLSKETDQQHYMFIYGMDRMGNNATASLSKVIHSGPELGTHVVASAGSLALTKRALGGYGNEPLELFEQRVLIDAPQDDVTEIAGYGYQWKPHERKGRAIVSEERVDARVMVLFA